MEGGNGNGGVLDNWISQMNKQDIRLKMKIGEDMLIWLDNESNSLQNEDVGNLIDGFVGWLSSSNARIQQNGLEGLAQVVMRMREDFRPYISTVLPACTDRMGDGKEAIRDLSAEVLNKMMEITSPQYILDRLTGAYTHKNFRVREEILLLIQDTVLRYTASCLSLSKFIPAICRLMDDPNAQVRDAAMTTLVVLYRYVGDRLRQDLHRKYTIHPNKLQALMERFDREDAQTPGSAGTATSIVVSTTGASGGDDETDKTAARMKPPVSAKKPAASGTGKQYQQPHSKVSSSTNPVSVGASSAGSLGRNPNTRIIAAASGGGGVDEEAFLEAFVDVPRISVFSARELEQQIANVRATISNAEADWDKRLHALKIVRSIVLAGAKDYDEFVPALRTLELSIQACVKDLRSQIVREACITIAYLCVQLNTKMDRFCEILLPSLILLMGASVKVMSTSGVVCIRFIIKHVPSQRLVPIIIMNLASKNRDIRRHCFEFLNEILHLWPTFTLERHIAILQQAIKAGLSDADQEARSHSRKAFWAFADHFKAQADSLLFSLDSNKQKMLHGELGGGGMSNSSSSSSLNNMGRVGVTRYGNSMESLKHPATTSGSHHSATKQHLASTSRLPQAISSASTDHQRRANSAIDIAAAKSSRLKALSKTPYVTSSGYGYGGSYTPMGQLTSHYAFSQTGMSLPRSTLKSSRAESVCSAVTSPERALQSTPRGRQVSQSQPNSRSASPSSRWSYTTYGAGNGLTPDGRRAASRSRIPMPTSRDPSPSRSIGSQSSSSALSDSQRRRRRYSRGEACIRIVPSTPTAAERLLRNSRDAEERMAEALGSTTVRSPLSASYGRLGLLHREDSDVSSVASDRSFRHEDVPEILANLASVHWSDRKDGLTGLLCLLRNQSHALSDPDLQKVIQTLTRMFMDPHTKVFSLFLDTLNELITVHSADLHRIGFLSVLLTKLFIKSGQDLLGSVVTKIGRTMDLIRSSFPRHDQFTVITRFLNDPAHSSSPVKVKLSVLSYFETLTSAMDSSELPAHDPNLRDTLLKITTWAGDSRHVELQQRARSVIVSLYRVKTPYFSTVITQMAPEFQRTALDVIQGQLTNTSGRCGSHQQHQSAMALSNHVTSSRLLGGSSSPYGVVSTSLSSIPFSVRVNDTRSRPKPGAYQADDTQRSFEDENSENVHANPTIQLNKIMQTLNVRDSTGVSHDIEGVKSTDDDADSCKTRHSQGSSSSPKCATQSLEFEIASLASNASSGSAAVKSSGPERLAHCVQLLSSPMNSAEQKRSALAELHILVKDPSLWESEPQYRSVWRALVLNITTPDDGGRDSIRAPALRALAELVRKRPRYAQSAPLIQNALRAVICVCNDKDKDVVRLADAAISVMVASVNPPIMAQACAHSVLAALTAGDSGKNHSDSRGATDAEFMPGDAWAVCASIRSVTRLAEAVDAEAARSQLAELGPPLIRAYDHPESSVRKAAVFALVALHQRVGADSMHPYLSHLPGCKMRLLNLYIDRAAQHTNGGHRGESSPSPSTCSNASNM